MFAIQDIPKSVGTIEVEHISWGNNGSGKVRTPVDLVDCEKL